ncbi:hypothetical protein HZA43_01265 [Candidatus Peregrinibacteria bacterium]|nr:hypothetical protein [Candidatus Peregrinibacteria bacterium]
MKAEALHLFYHRVFTLEEIHSAFKEPLSTIKVHLFRLHKKGTLVRLKKNCYVFSQFPQDSLLIGQQMVMPSYHSLEWALSRQGIIPEGVTAYTLVTSQKTQRYQTPFGNFSYRHLGPSLFFGVEKRTDGVWMATKEKALLDYLYLNSEKFTPGFSCWQAERFDELDTLDWEQIKKWAPEFHMKKLVGLISSLEKYARSDVYQEHR